MDIDLDYFACRDSVVNNFRYALEITRQQFRDQGVFLNNDTLRFGSLAFRFARRNNKYFAQIGYKKTQDKAYLPKKNAIEAEMNTLIEQLKAKNIKPVVITLSRSCLSGYCPKNYYKFIERLLEKKLGCAFNA